MLQTKELREHGLSGGYNCFPICVNCLRCGKKVATKGRKNEMQVRKEKVRNAKTVKGDEKTRHLV